MSQKKTLPVTLVVGPKSQMKKKFLESQKLFDRRIPINKLEMYLGSSHEIVLIKPQGLEMDSISREKSFMNFHSILDLGFRSLNMIFYVVKFDRIDFMKALISPFLVKFKKYMNEITLIVTGLDFSNQQEYDKELLINMITKTYKLQNYIICGSTEDVSNQIIYKVSASQLQLDLNSLNLQPGKVDEDKLNELKKIFDPRSVIVGPNKPISTPQDKQQRKSTDSQVNYKNVPQHQIQNKQPQSQIVGSSREEKPYQQYHQFNSSQHSHIYSNQKGIQQMPSSMCNKKQK